MNKAKHYINNQNIDLEVYVSGATNKYVTVTGDVLIKADVLPDCTDVLKIILEKYMKRCQDEDSPMKKLQAADRLSDLELITKMKNAHNGTALAALWAGGTSSYKSSSEADMALCSMLAFWTGEDAEWMDKLSGNQVSCAINGIGLNPALPMVLSPFSILLKVALTHMIPSDTSKSVLMAMPFISVLGNVQWFLPRECG